jgi:hypothetical protein
MHRHWSYHHRDSVDHSDIFITVACKLLCFVRVLQCIVYTTGQSWHWYIHWLWTQGLSPSICGIAVNDLLTSWDVINVPDADADRHTIEHGTHGPTARRQFYFTLSLRGTPFPFRFDSSQIPDLNWLYICCCCVFIIFRHLAPAKEVTTVPIPLRSLFFAYASDASMFRRTEDRSHSYDVNWKSMPTWARYHCST